MSSRTRGGWILGAVTLALMGLYAWHAWERSGDEVTRGGKRAGWHSSEVVKPASSRSDLVSLPADSEPPEVQGRDRFGDADLIAERWLSDPQGNVRERWRLVALPTRSKRLARVVDRLGEPNPDGARTIVGQSVMTPDSVVVAIPDGTRPDELVARLQAAGFETDAAHATDAVVTVRLAQSDLDAVPAALRRISSEISDAQVEPNFLYFPLDTVSNDYHGRVMWGLENIEAPAAWTVSTGSASVVVAVIDSGIDLTHPDLVANIWTNPGEVAGNGNDDDNNGFVDDIHGWDFADGDATPADQSDHGTHVSGTIGAVGNNGTGVVGVNWNVRLMPLRAGDETFEGSNTLNAIRYVNTMKEKGIPIVAINASYGGSSQSSIFRQELVKARDNGILFVAAAGNDGTNNDTSPVYPASYDVENIIAVASIRPGNTLSNFSDFGQNSVDLAAPGTGIRSTIRDGEYAFFNGTSMATPHVTGAVALVAAANPSLSSSGIRSRILSTVEKEASLTNRVASGGRLNLRRAVDPTVLAPRVAITTPAVDLVLMDRPGVPLSLAASLQDDGGSTPTANLTWSTVSGPTPVVFGDAGAASTTATFPVEGRYWLRVEASSGALTRSDDLFVAVGESALDAPTNGLVGWWRFDETGGTARDSSSASRDGAIVDATRVAGIEGGGLNFDGFSGRVAISAPSLPKITIAGWIRPAASASVSIFPRVIHMQSGLLFLGVDDSTEADDGNNNTLKFARDDGTGTRVWFAPPGTADSGGGWIHVAATFDESAGDAATPKIYYDGESQLVGTQESPASTPSVELTEGYLGDRGDGGREWNGDLDDIRLYNRELTEDELAVLAHALRMSACLRSRVTADLSSGGLDVPVGWVAADGAPTGADLSNPVWSAVDATVQVAGNVGTETSVTFPDAGDYVLRLDATVDDRFLLVRTLPVIVNTNPVAIAGRYAGTTSSGGSFVLEVDGSGTATFVGGAGSGLFQTDIAVSAFGSFAFAARSGEAVSGQISPEGDVSGVIGSAEAFVGSRDASAADNGSVDGAYTGWLLDGGVRAGGVVANGTVALTVEEKGTGRSGSGALDGSGSFEFVGVGGGAFAGTVSGGRIESTYTAPDASTRTLVLLRAGEERDARLSNLSARGVAASGEDAMIAGFVLDGTDTLPVLVRGVGPALGDFGVSNALAEPSLSLRSSSELLDQNTSWDADGNGAVITDATTRTGAFALPGGSHDAALLADVAGGSYTALVEAPGAESGNVLAEIYDARESPRVTRLLNLSARARVGEGESVMIGGFVIEGTDPALVLVRAAGPSLSGFGVASALPLTELTLWRGGTRLASSEAWGEGANAKLIAEVSSSVGAFAFADRSADAALLAYLAPGAYTATVAGREGDVGVALVEVYLVDNY